MGGGTLSDAVNMVKRSKAGGGGELTRYGGQIAHGFCMDYVISDSIFLFLHAEFWCDGFEIDPASPNDGCCVPTNAPNPQGCFMKTGWRLSCTCGLLVD